MSIGKPLVHVRDVPFSAILRCRRGLKGVCCLHGAVVPCTGLLSALRARVWSRGGVRLTRGVRKPAWLPVSPAAPRLVLRTGGWLGRYERRRGAASEAV